MSWLAGYGKLNDEENDNLGVDWVLQYEFSDIGMSPIQCDAHQAILVDPSYLNIPIIHIPLTPSDQSQAISEFRTLVNDLTEAGLRVQVRHGHGSSLLLCLRVPRDRLGNMIHQSR